MLEVPFAMQDFRRLRVWRESHELAVAVREGTRRFPRSGYSTVRDQLNRSAESIAFNIAEGCGASTPKEFGRYLNIGIKSACELESQLELAKNQGILRPKEWTTLSERTVMSRRMLFALRSRVLATTNGPSSPDGDKPKTHDTKPNTQNPRLTTQNA